MRISENCLQGVKCAIKEVFSNGRKDPKKFLTEHDLQAWIFRELVTKLDISAGQNLGIHCQTRFLDQNNNLLLEPDIAIFNQDEYTIGSNGSLTNRKGYTFWGAAILIEIKLIRECRRLPLYKALADIEKLAQIRELHYSIDTENHEYYPLFVLFSKSPLSEQERMTLKERAQKRAVTLLLEDAQQQTF